MTDFDKELIEAFQEESNGLIQELNTILDQLDQEPGVGNTQKLLEKYGQIIDRMMGAAKAMELKRISNFCELGKIIGYKSSQSDDSQLHQLVVAFLFDATELLSDLVRDLPQSEDESHPIPQASSLLSRMKWLMDKFKHIERASVDFGNKK